ncbi:homoserine kinase [Ichthyenterobacterium sp. W332]|uniref:Homoserine kinase n=1 Tax=Microcosmobacter mediterraneus TaxID=3075607 RepID=A0ABU2YNV5_9FLAO|nr:homoserine kinase [Ichthyenterobacterium sp. W332]MDT0559485.1 homoserine kinase [Ichthyenterobacterium sp. W332]
MPKSVKIFSPATVANLSCGFDTLGVALDGKGDTMIFTKTDKNKVVITKIKGANLPYDINQNLVGVIAQKMLNESKADFGLDIEIYKGFIPGSGLGSSAASAAGTAFGVNVLLEGRFNTLELVNYARLGEEVACGSPIADNVSAAIYGGFVLVRSTDPLDVISLPVPDDLFITALHPQIEIKTEDARTILPTKVPLKDAINQWANVGALVSALYSSDYQLLQRALKDYIVEPYRKQLIPHFDDLKKAALQAGALGAGISGAGPTIFALSKGEKLSYEVLEAMGQSYKNKGIDFNIFNSKISTKGVRLI